MAINKRSGLTSSQTYKKLYYGNWLLKFDTTKGGAATEGKYSTDRGASWMTIDDDSGKIECYGSYLYVEQTTATGVDTNLLVWELPPKAEAILEGS